MGYGDVNKYNVGSKYTCKVTDTSWQLWQHCVIELNHLSISLCLISLDRETNLKGYMENDHSNCVVHDDTFDWGG